MQKPQPANNIGQVTFVLPCQPLLLIPCGVPWVAQVLQTPETPHNPRWSEWLGAHRLITLHRIRIPDSWMTVEAEHLKTSNPSPVSSLMQPLSCTPAPAENIVQQQLLASVLRADSSRVGDARRGDHVCVAPWSWLGTMLPQGLEVWAAPVWQEAQGGGAGGDRVVERWT